MLSSPPARSITLRAYQREAVEALYEHLRRRDDNPCVVIPTAGGKTPVMATVCKDAVGRWEGRVLIVAHVKELLEQAVEKLRLVAPEMWHQVGVYSAGLERRDRDHPIIVAGVQSVYRRARELGRFDLVLIDEAHMVPPDGEGMYRTFLADAKAVNPNVRLIGLTATPFRMTTGTICSPENLLNHVCYEVSVRELIVQGYLCPLVAKGTREDLDTSGLHVRAGEFVADEVEALMDQTQRVEAACAEIVEQTRERKSILVFASGVQHARHVAEGEFDAKCKRMLEVLTSWRQRRGDAWMPHWELSRRLKWSDKDIEEVRNALRGQRRIEHDVGSTAGGGPVAQRYRLLVPSGVGQLPQLPHENVVTGNGDGTVADETAGILSRIHC